MKSSLQPSFQEIADYLEYDPLDGTFLAKKAGGPFKAGRNVATHNRVTGYFYIHYKGRNFYCHRVAWLLMTGEWPKEQIDHIDRNKANNKWVNLREASGNMNKANVEKRKTNKSGYKGVSPNYRPTWKPWRAYIQFEKKTLALGSFDDPVEAAKAYDKKAKELFGEFAVLNFP